MISNLTIPARERDNVSDISATSSNNPRACEDDAIVQNIFRTLDVSDNDHINSGDFLDVFESVGLSRKDPRLSEVFKRLDKMGGLRKDIELDFEQFSKIVKGSTVLLSKCMKGLLTVPDWETFKEEIGEIYEKCANNNGGDIATYIPQLALQDPKRFGISICTIDGQILNIGDEEYKFCVQSCCKPIAYLIAVQEKGFDFVHHHVGREPSGASFNNLSLKEYPSKEFPNRRIPHNPMINSGAIMSSSIIKADSSMADRFSHVMKTWNRLCGSPVGFSNSVYLSEKDTADRNWCLGYMMQEYHSFPENTDLTASLEFYFQQCSIEANMEQMSIMAATLANGGANPLTGDRIFDPFHVRNCLSLMLSSGMYDYSGEWCFSVGLPAKSGVAGCIWCVIPNKMGVAVFSPKLDEHGNSTRGVQTFLELVEKYNFHQYDSLKGVIASTENHETHQKKDPTLRPGAHNINLLTALLFACAEGDLNEIMRIRSAGGNLWGADYDKRTCLHLAASEGHLHVVNYFIRIARRDENADLSPKDRWDRTPLDDAIAGNHTEVVAILRKANAQTSV